MSLNPALRVSSGGILDVLVAGKEFQRVDFIQRHEGIRRIVRDGRRAENSIPNTPTPGASRLERPGKDVAVMALLTFE